MVPSPLLCYREKMASELPGKHKKGTQVKIIYNIYYILYYIYIIIHSERCGSVHPDTWELDQPIQWTVPTGRLFYPS